MSTESKCIFCRILAGEAEGSLVWRDELCAAFMDIEPINPGHLLVVPLRHAASLEDVEAQTAARMMQVAQRLMTALRAAPLRCEGINLLLADGAPAGQEVFHVHLHVVPRFQGDDFRMSFGPDRRMRPRGELDDCAETIRRQLAAPPGGR